MRNTLIIPDRLNVGFQNRSDTYSKLLAYITYYDHKGKLRKATSWEGWREQGIPPIEYSNTPTEGFVLNKDVGGTRHSYSWNARLEKVRVWDPRNFEFEITIPNLLYILQECTSSRGKGLEGKFVYAWDGPSLILMPVGTPEFAASVRYSDLQGAKVKSRDLIPGHTYMTKSQQNVVYLGRFNYHTPVRLEPHVKLADADLPKPVKKHVFHGDNGFYYMDGVAKIGQHVSDIIPDNFSDLVAKYDKSEYGSAVVRLFAAPGVYQKYSHLSGHQSRDHIYDTLWAAVDPANADHFLQLKCGTAVRGYYSSGNNDKDVIASVFRHTLKDGTIFCQPFHGEAWRKGAPIPSRSYHLYNSWETSPAPVSIDWIEPTSDYLYAELASGTICQVIGSDLFPPTSKELKDGQS